MKSPKVSVCVISYNQERYIQECLESILNQKCDFDFEVIVNDDNSKDKTGEICSRFAERNKDLIRLQLNTSNLGMMANWLDSLKRAKGKYIAICEGDDYWTSSNKLQVQFDFLESNKEFVGCFHNTEERFEENHDLASYLYCKYSQARRISFEDLSAGNLIPTCSVMYRNSLFADFPDWYSGLRMCDWPLHLLNAQFGDFWYIPKVMGVHRLHSQSIWMLQDATQNNKFVVDAYDRMILAFSNNEKYRNWLVIGRDKFLGLGLPKKLSFRRRLRHLADRIVARI